MRGNSIYVIVILLVLLIPSVSAAVIHGAIYDKNLNPLSKTVIHINTTPIQRHISKYGGYSFAANEGRYVISANYTLNNITRTIAEEYVDISDDGDYRIDLFVFDDINISEGFETEEEKDLGQWLLLGLTAALLLVILGVTIWYYKRIVHSLKKSGEPRSSVVAISNDTGRDPLADKIVLIIKKNKGSMSQKDIRKYVRYSEAKVSMALTQMEKSGSIKKTKKGRSNFVILVKKRS
jgi:uncharacterized membrane protein